MQIIYLISWLFLISQEKDEKISKLKSEFFLSVN